MEAFSSDAQTLASEAIISSKKSTANREAREPLFSGEITGECADDICVEFPGESGEFVPQRFPRPEGGETTTRRH